MNHIEIRKPVIRNTNSVKSIQILFIPLANFYDKQLVKICVADLCQFSTHFQAPNSDNISFLHKHPETKQKLCIL